MRHIFTEQLLDRCKTPFPNFPAVEFRFFIAVVLCAPPITTKGPQPYSRVLSAQFLMNGKHGRSYAQEVILFKFNNSIKIRWRKLALCF